MMENLNQRRKSGKLGPGSDADTLRVLGIIPDDTFELIVDAGCGVGRQTLALSNQLQTPIHAVDVSRQYLDTLQQQADESGVGHLVTTHCMDMADIPANFREIDLLWSECAAYHIGFAKALQSWHAAIRPGGYAVVSELSWLRQPIPNEAREYLQKSYPDMRSLEANVAIAQDAGYQLLATHVLSRTAWIEDYYEVLLPLAQSLLNHPEKTVRNFAEETLKGVQIFEYFGESYGYVFFVLKKD